MFLSYSLKRVSPSQLEGPRGRSIKQLVVSHTVRKQRGQEVHLDH